MSETTNYVIIQPNGDETTYDTMEQAVDALQYYPKGKAYTKTISLIEIEVVEEEE